MKIGPACQYLGGICEDTLYSAVREGKCRAARIGAGRNLLFSDTWLDEYATRCAEQRDRAEPIALRRPRGAA
jgi:excisionase family DNA binding protein